MANEVEIVVRARDESAAGIDAAKARLRQLAKDARDVPSDVTIKAEADTAKAEADIARLEQKLAQNDVAKIKVEADTKLAEAELEKLRSQAERATGTRKIEVKADIAAAEAKLALLGARMRHLDADTESTLHRVERLQHGLQRLGEDGGSSIDRLRMKLKKLVGDGVQPLLDAIVLLGPALLPIAGLAVQAVGSLAGSFASAGAALGVFGAVLLGTFGEVKEAAGKTDALREKIRLLDREVKLAEPGSKAQTDAMKAQAKATLELKARLDLLPPSTRMVVSAFQRLKDAWSDFRDDNQGTVYGILTRVFAVAKDIIPKLQPLFDVGARVTDRLISALERKVKDGGVESVIKWLADHAGSALADAIGIIKNLAVAIGRFVQATDDGGGALHWVEEMTGKLADFTKSQAFSDFLKWVRENGPGVGASLAQIARSAVKIAQAVGPLAPVSEKIADALARIIDAVPVDVITGIVGAFMAWRVATLLLTGAQIALDLALDANPIGLIILAIGALVAGLIYAYNHSETFRNIVNAVAGAIWDASKAVYNFTRTLIGYVGSAVAFVIDRFGDMASFVGGVLSHIPGMGAAGKALQNLGASAHAAAQKVRDVADAIAGVHSKTVTIRVQTLTSRQMISQAGGYHEGMAHGGIVGRAAGGGPRSNRTLVGENGPELVDLAPGSTVHSNPDSARMLGGSAGDGRIVLEIKSGGTAMDDLLVQILRKAVRTRGGDVQLALGT